MRPKSKKASSQLETYLNHLAFEQRRTLFICSFAVAVFALFISLYVFFPMKEQAALEYEVVSNSLKNKQKEILRMQAQELSLKRMRKHARLWVSQLIPAPSKSSHAAHWSSVAKRYGLKLNHIQFIEEKTSKVYGRAVKSETLLLEIQGRRLAFEQLSSEVGEKLTALHMTALPSGDDEVRVALKIKTLGVL